MMNEIKNSRTSYFDILKILAIIFVVFQHTGQNGCLYFIHARNSFFYYPYLIIGLFSKISVPLFFMCSGALLLGKEEDFKTLFIKRILRFLIVLCACSLIMYIYQNRSDLSEASISDFIKILYSKNIIVPYWYLYSYIAYLFMLPFLRKIAKNFDQKSGRYLLMCFAAYQLLGMIGFLVWKEKVTRNSDFSFFISARNTFYPLAGYYIHHFIDPKKESGIKKIITVSASLLTLIFVAFVTTYRCNLFDNWSESSAQTYFNTLAFVPSVSVFYLAKCREPKQAISDKVRIILAELSSLTFGIYLFESLLKKVTNPFFKVLKTMIHPYIACWIWVLATVVLGGIIFFLLKKLIKPLNKYI